MAINNADHQTTTSFYFLILGFIIPIVFFLTTFVCGVVLGDYNHLSRMVSELGAMGTKSQYLFSIGLLTCSTLSVLFISALYSTARTIGISTLPVLILPCYSVSIAGAAIFPLPLRLHLIMGMPSVLLFLSPLLGVFLWRTANLRYLYAMALISFFMMSLGFMAYLPDIFSGYSGLKQRLFHLGRSVWFSYLGFAFTRLLPSVNSFPKIN
jgi:hypothetical protein